MPLARSHRQAGLAGNATVRWVADTRRANATPAKLAARAMGRLSDAGLLAIASARAFPLRGRPQDLRAMGSPWPVPSCNTSCAVTNPRSRPASAQRCLLGVALSRRRATGRAHGPRAHAKRAGKPRPVASASVLR